MAKQPSHVCDKSSEIAKLQTEMEDITHIIKDNGQQGLQTTVIKLTVTTEDLKKSVEGLKTAITAINKFMSEYEGARQKTEKMNVNMKWIIGTLLVVITVLFGSGVLN